MKATFADLKLTQDQALSALGVLKSDDAPPAWPKCVAALAAIGLGHSQIAEALEAPEEQIFRLLGSGQVKEFILNLQIQMGLSPAERLERYTNQAIDAKVRLMREGRNETTKNAIATDFLDRALGKAIQRTESKVLTMSAQDLKEIDSGLLELESQIFELEKAISLGAGEKQSS